MRIRAAELADIDFLLALDHSYPTDHVWQMSGRQTGPRDLSGEFSALFRLAALPRQIQVQSPHDARNLRRIINRCDYVWVAQGDDAREPAGYIGLASVPWQNTGWIPCLVIHPPMRRKGVASQLLKAAIAQSRADGLHSITIDIQTKNYPATRFCQARGFRFAGYSDNYYATQDIALFFAHRIR